MAEKWVSKPDSNFGVIMKATNEDVDGCDVRMRSSEFSDTTYCPYLEVTYSRIVARNYYLKDHLGSNRMTLTITGAVDSYNDFYPFGMQMEGRNLVANADARYKFTSKERDDETGYDYFGARYYDAKIGRWLSVDPLVEKYPSVSPYVYCQNNPIMAFDPNGLWVFSLQNEARYIIPLFAYSIGMTVSTATGCAFNGNGDILMYSSASIGFSLGAGIFCGFSGSFFSNLNNPSDLLQSALNVGFASAPISIEGNLPNFKLKNWGVTVGPGFTFCGFSASSSFGSYPCIGGYAEYAYTIQLGKFNIFELLKKGDTNLLEDPILNMFAEINKMPVFEFICLIISTINEKNGSNSGLTPGQTIYVNGEGEAASAARNYYERGYQVYINGKEYNPWSAENP